MSTVRYTTIEGEVIAEKRSGVRSLYVPDALGSTVALLNSSNNQTPTATFSYYPYGSVASRTGTTPTPYQFVGTHGYYADISGKTYVRMRYLDSSKGKWLTQDPIGFQGGDANLYRYAKNKSITRIDPSGLDINFTTQNCDGSEKAQIQKAMTRICANKKYLNYLNSSECQTGNFPGDIGQNTISDCIKGWCNATSEQKQLNFYCNHNYISNRTPGCWAACASTDPGKQIMLCMSNIDTNACDSWQCVIAHELLHICGILGHNNDAFNALKNIPGCNVGYSIPKGL